MKQRSMTLAALAAGLFVVACAAEPAAEDAGESEGAYTAPRNVSLKYEGTCEFLRSCSTYSRNLPVGEVMWGCGGRGSCSDSGLWVAGPTHSYCGQTVRICKGSTCTSATVKDVSVSHDWEASNGVLDALGLPHGLSGRCGGFGGGAVTLTVGGGADAPSAPRAGGGCYSSTLGEDVDELACVEASSNGVWFQCKNGRWYGGVSGSSGPYGTCSSVHAR